MALNKQLDTTNEKVRISNLLLNREIYLNFPDCQRNSGIWPRSMEQLLIDTILRGDYIPPIVAYRDGETGNLCVLDGQQRLTTIVKYVNNGFCTGRARRLGEQFIAPGCYFSTLSDEYKRRIESYLITFDILQTENPQRLIENYKKVQHLVQLKSAEIAYANDSLAKEAAMQIQEHAYFSQIYTGQKLRMQSFQMAIYLLEMETFHVCCDLREGKIKGVGAGGRDELITDELVGEIQFKLNQVLHLFEGLNVRSPNAIILHYQAVSFLDFARYNIHGSERGCLKTWYESLVADMHFYSRLAGAAFQTTFWKARLEDVACMPGLLPGPDSRRDITRLSSWLRNVHICPHCRDSVKLEDIRQHSFALSDPCTTKLERNLKVVS